MSLQTKMRVRVGVYKLLAGLFLCVWLGPVSCHPTQYARLPTSSWGDRFAYVYEPPQGPRPTPVPVTVMVVNTEYRVTESALALDLYSKVGKGFSSSMGVDLDKVLINKGLTTKGPFHAFEEVTYYDKKSSGLALESKIWINTEVKNPTDWIQSWYTGVPEQTGVEQVRGRGGVRVVSAVQRQVTVKSTGWIAFVLNDPVSHEKLWIKRLELEPNEVQAQEIYADRPVYVDDGCGGRRLVGHNPSDIILYDGKVDAMATALKKYYPTIMEKFQTYLDIEELQVLQKQGQEIRAKKVYE